MMDRNRFIARRTDTGKKTIGSFWRANSQGRLEQKNGPTLSGL
jgi:hypothetical protein